MGMVGGSRHYDGGGLGPLSGWACPACGAENQGPLELGCGICGAGRPGRFVGAQPPKPPAATRVAEALEPVEEPPPAQQAPQSAPPVLNPAQAWIREHPGASMEEAFTAGYIAGIHEARRAQLMQQPSPMAGFNPDGAAARTIAAALELFREQVLATDPEEVTTGEWLNAHQVTGLIREIRGEVLHG